MDKLKTILFFALAISFSMCKEAPSKIKSQIETKEIKKSSLDQVTKTSEVEWEKLNPARGDKSPQAGTLYGDRNGTEATGFLIKFVDGFSSPPHIHNVSYRAMVIKGKVHNDDPAAAKMWMPAGSFWTQPAGEVHITAASGSENIGYVEIESGPYLVQPIDEASDNGERPINIDPSNYVWLNNTNSNWISTSGPELTNLWGQLAGNNLNGTLLKLPAGFEGTIQNEGDTFHGVLIQGNLTYKAVDNTIVSLDEGGFFKSQEPSIHTIKVGSTESLIYIRSNDKYIVANK